MAIDITNHEAVPEHRKLDEDEAEEVLDKFEISRENLPKIERTDAALKQMDVEEEDVIEIVRDSPTAGKSTYYRVVVDR